MTNAVIFDLDGTLLNTLDDLAAAVNFALRSGGFPTRTTAQVRRFVGNGVAKLIQRAAPQDIGADEWQECFRQFRAYYLEHLTDRTKPYAGVLSLLDSLRARGVGIAVVSNKLHKGVAELCDAFFGERVDVCFGVNEDCERKPAPLTTLRAMEALGASADKTLYVGDSEVDVQTAKNAGLRCVGVTWGFRDREELEAAGAWRIVNTPEEVLQLITES